MQGIEIHTVFMKSPDGEIREVAATEDVLVPLMVKGWNQYFPPADGEAK